jgi:hypothetical protein
MALFARNRLLIPLIFSAAVAFMVVPFARSASGREPDDQASTSASGAPPLGLGLGHASHAEVLARIVDRSGGHVAIDPDSLHPPALSPDSNDGFVWHEPKPYTCWVVEPGEHRDYAPNTAVACFVRVTLGDRFVNGDGSLLADRETGKPDDFFGYDCPQGFTVKDFTNNRWIAVRYYDSNLNQIGAIRAATYDGINYNYTTGKAVELHAHFIEIDTMQPVDGTADHEYSKFLGDDYGPVIGPHGEIRADSAGRIDYTPGLASILYMTGPHPLDAFFAGDPSGILPVCRALK